MSFHDDDHATLDLVLGQTHHLLGEDGDTHAQRPVQAATLRAQRDGGIYHPMPGDNWDEPSYEAVLCMDPNLVPEFTTEVTGRIWAKLEPVLRGRDRTDVFGVVVDANVPPLPEVGEDWRARAVPTAAVAPPTSGAARACGRWAPGARWPGARQPRGGGRVRHARGIAADPPASPDVRGRAAAGVKLRDAGVRTPDFLVLGNGRAIVIEVDGVHHYGATRKADDADRDRHWTRCNVPTVRIAPRGRAGGAARAAGRGAGAPAVAVAT